VTQFSLSNNKETIYAEDRHYIHFL